MATLTAEARKEPSAALGKLSTCPNPCHQSSFFNRLLLTLLPNRIDKVVCHSASIRHQIAIFQHSGATSTCYPKNRKAGPPFGETRL